MEGSTSDRINIPFQTATQAWRNPTPNDSRKLLQRIAWTAVITVHVALLMPSITALLVDSADANIVADRTIFLAICAVLAVCTLVFSRWRFAWVFPPAISVLAGLVAISSSGLFVVQSILISVVFMQVVLMWKGTARVSILLVCVLLSVLVVVRYGASIPRALGQAAGAMVVGITVAAIIGLADSALARLTESDEELASLRDAIGRISEANLQYQDYAMQVADESSLEERRRISRDLHDVMGLSFTNIIAMMNAVLSAPLTTDEEQHDLFEWIRETAQSGLRDTRTILYELRSVPEQRRPTIEVIGRLIDAFQKATNMNVNVEWGNLPFYLPQTINSAVIHLIQEALVNSFRHGRASQVQLFFFVNGEILHVTVKDNGTGGPTERYGIGQTGITERLLKLQGTVKFVSSAVGYRVDATFPVGALPA